jgi:hypothetical protein
MEIKTLSSVNRLGIRPMYFLIWTPRVSPSPTSMGWGEEVALRKATKFPAGQVPKRRRS